MEKRKKYRNIRFDPRTFSEADTALGPKLTYAALDVRFPDSEQWSFNTFEEFLAAADRGEPYYSARTADGKRSLFTYADGRTSMVSASAHTRNEIESLFSVFEKNAERCRLPQESAPPSKIFIGHGRNPQWRDLKDHLHEKHGYAVEAYEIGSREGHAVRDILEEMLDESSFALLVMTGEDETKDGNLRAVKTSCTNLASSRANLASVARLSS